jgi:hypothetical protein
MSIAYEGPQHRLAQAKVELLTAVLLNCVGGARILDALARHEGAVQVAERTAVIEEIAPERDALEVAADEMDIQNNPSLANAIRRILAWQA